MARFTEPETKDARRERQQREAEAAPVDRRKRRAAAQAGYAACEAAKAEYLVLRDALSVLHSRMDQAAEVHARESKPIQSELTTLGNDQRSSKRRLELLAELAGVNAKLETKLHELKHQAQTIQWAALAAGKRAAEAPRFVAELRATAAVPVVAASLVAGRTVRLAEARLRQAEAGAKQFPDDPVSTLELTIARRLHSQALDAAAAADAAVLADSE